MRLRLAQSGDASYDKVEMVRSAYFSPCRCVARTLASRFGDPGISVTEGSANKVGVGGNPLAYLEELFVTSGVVKTAL